MAADPKGTHRNLPQRTGWVQELPRGTSSVPARVKPPPQLPRQESCILVSAHQGGWPGLMWKILAPATVLLLSTKLCPSQTDQAEGPPTPQVPRQSPL